MPITLADAMNMRKKREALLLDENPALASSMVPTGSTATPNAYPDQASYAGVPKPPKRNRPSNGAPPETGNGTPNASTSSGRYPRDSMQSIDASQMPPPPQHLRWQSNSYLDQHPDGRRAPPANGLVSVHPPPPTTSSSIPAVNGFASPSTRPHPFVRQSVSPPYQNEDLSDRESHPPASVYTESQAPSQSITPPAGPPSHDGQDPPQGNGVRSPGQTIGPAAAFARGAPAPTPAPAPSAFGRVSQNPGRTIYSQSRPD